MDGDAIGEIGRFLDTGTNLPDGFMPYWIINCSEVEVPIRCVYRNTEVRAKNDLFYLSVPERIIKPVIAVSNNLLAGVAGILNTIHPTDVIPDLRGG